MAQLALLADRIQPTSARRVEAPAPDRATAPRYRLSLIREGVEDYNPALPLGDPEAAAAFLAPRLELEPAEAMAVLYLDVRNRLIGYAVPYRGGIARACVEPRGILAPALLCNAAGIILAHNHPSGDPSPSAEDLALTRRIADAGEILGIRLLDHIIVGDGKTVSLRRRGGW
jgi:DNA repair protein RadC